MFELPDAKRVRREDLYSPRSSRSSTPDHDPSQDAELRAKLNERLSGLLALPFTADSHPAEDVAATQDEVNQDQDHDQEGHQAAEFTFRLFSTAAVEKVVLAPDDAEEAAYSGPAISQRPLSHYLRGELTPQQRAQFEQAAVTGREVLAWAGQRAWGLEVPWRVTRVVVTVNGKEKGAVVVGDAGESSLLQGSGEGKDAKKKKTRPGKKTRIVLRKREKAKREAEAAKEKLKMSKEEHLREKKKRLNREKKLKRRQKEREKKMAAKGEAGGSVGGMSAAGSGDEGSSDSEA